MLDDKVEDYVNDYCFRGDDGDFSPNEWQRLMIADAIHGFIAEFCNEEGANK